LAFQHSLYEVTSGQQGGLQISNTSGPPVMWF